MILSTTVLDWRIDGNRRVHDKTNGDTYILNCDFMYDIHAHTDGSWMYYYDNMYDRQDGGAYLKCDTSPANIIVAADLIPVSETVTLPIFPDDVQTETAVDTTIMLDQFSRAWAHSNGTATYVVYADDAWNMIRVLCDMTLAELYTLISGI